ncbi:DUF5956 family protein [Streptomyces sp. G-G2]|uniref:DUF5956 family protein n=1 Tax=Streptomyces sp. G-G2 TaxID=3046201 RepID=UPI0024BADA1B|nr:DUF5956 family protein [Streptomyces sp. G-G2]MDJ0384493.1 DUF5956 family protein [Streptomyces sp. G-G2]
MSWDWDENGPPHPLALRRPGRSELEPDRLPEVRELEVLGWEPAPERALWVFLPYVWPAAARTWVPDRSTRWAVETRLDGHGAVTDVECAPLADADLHDLDTEAETALSALALPPRPASRLWLLRPVGPFADLEAVLAHLRAVADEREVPLDRASKPLMELVRRELDALLDSAG